MKNEKKGFKFNYTVCIEGREADKCNGCMFMWNSELGNDPLFCMVFRKTIKEDKDYDPIRLKECREAGKKAK